MTHHWDEFSKSLAEPVPRGESLRRLGIAISATVLGPLGSQFALGREVRTTSAGSLQGLLQVPQQFTIGLQ